MVLPGIYILLTVVNEVGTKNKWKDTYMFKKRERIHFTYVPYDRTIGLGCVSSCSNVPIC